MNTVFSDGVMVAWHIYTPPSAPLRGLNVRLWRCSSLTTASEISEMVDELSGALASSHSLEMDTPVFTLSMTLTVHERLYKVPLMGLPTATISTVGTGTAGERIGERDGMKN